MTADELAAKYGVGEPVDSGADALAAKYGISSAPAGKSPSDIPLRGMRPAVAPDDVSTTDVKPDYGKKNVNFMLRGLNPAITTPERHAQSVAFEDANDPIRHDPLAGMIVQGIPAAGAGAVAGGIARMVAPSLEILATGATAGAVSNPDNPLAGAALGAIPGVSTAARGAGRAIGEKAAEIATDPLRREGAGKIAKFIGGSIGTVVGHRVGGGLPGAMVGGYIGTKATSALSGVGDKLIDAAAARYLRSAASDVPVGIIPPTTLSPLVHDPLPLPTSVPNGALGTPFLDEFGVPVTKAGQGGFEAHEAATAAGPSKLRTDIVRDAKALGRAPVEEPSLAGNPSLEEQLQRSVKLMKDLRSGASSGDSFSAQVLDEVKRGMPLAKAVEKLQGRK